MLNSGELHINDDNWQEHVDAVVDGDKKAKGLIPRDYETHPQGFYASAPAFDLELVPRDQLVDRIREMEETKSRISDLRRTSGPNGGRIPSLDQNGIKYCWNHSVTMAIILARAKMGLPYVRLSAFFIGCLIKKYKNQGGWSPQALDFVTEHGVPDVKYWPEKSMKKSNDTPECRANALFHRVVTEWADMSAAVYDRNLTEDQSFTLLVNRVAHPEDYNWWGHSVCIMDPVLLVAKSSLKSLPDLSSLDLNNLRDAKVFASVLGKRGINSWTDQWGTNGGEFVLSGTKMHCDGGAAPRDIFPSEQ